ncbi:MAG: DoxX family protein [Psychromonas sp.]
MQTTLFTLSILLSIFFVFASSIKILAWQKAIFDIQLTFFISYGLNRQIMFLIGLIELSGVILLWSPWTLLGALVIAGTSVGAIFFHLRFDTWKDAIPAIVTLILSSFLAINLIGII